MNTRIYLFLVSFTCFISYAFYAQAQNEADALRYSYLSPQGTARSMGIGGALGSIGGDFTSLSVNPAGIAVYRTSEFMFTPSIKLNNADGSYLNFDMKDNGSRFTFNNLGVVFTSTARGRRYDNSKWKSVSFGFGINRLGDFNRNYTYSGINTTSSGAERFSIDANDYPGDINNNATLAGLGYQSQLIYYNNGDSSYHPQMDYGRIPLTQTKTVRERGGMTDLVFSLGGNYEEKLLIGATLGIPSFRYTYDATYTESDNTSNDTNYFKTFQYNESLVTKGSGINLKLGFIYKANDNFRLGMAFHTPTYFNLKDVQNRSLTANTENFNPASPTVKATGIENYFEYSLVTPWRTVFSASGIVGKYGFITADYEYVNYASASFVYDPAYLAEERAINQSIKSAFRGTSNVRIGGEARIDHVMIRLGFGYYGSPYNNNNILGDKTEISAGLGYRESNWYADIAFVHSQYKNLEHPYILNYSAPVGIIAPTASLSNKLDNIALTIGFKF